VLAALAKHMTVVKRDAQEDFYTFDAHSATRHKVSCVSRYPMSLKGSEWQVSKVVNSDTCPRPTTKAHQSGAVGEMSAVDAGLPDVSPPLIWLVSGQASPLHALPPFPSASTAQSRAADRQQLRRQAWSSGVA
jgi:hypothetical protein